MPSRSRFGFTTGPVYLMDGSAFIFRSFYAFRNMSRPDGFPTNVLHMVGRLLARLLREEKPEALGFIMDGKGPTFRNGLYPDYKAQRPPTPEALVQQLEPLRELLALLGIPVLVSDGCEADDCIASLAERFKTERPVVIVGADKDLKQCLDETVLLWDPAAKEEKIATLETFRAEMEFEPSSWPDFQALVGDASDNIPGVSKIGPKTAQGLIRDFRTLEELFDRLPAVPPKIRPKLEGQREKALLYRELTRLRRDTCEGVGLAALRPAKAGLGPALEFMARYELRALAREVESMSRAGFFQGAPAPGTPGKAPDRAPAGAALEAAGGGGPERNGKDLRPGEETGPEKEPGPNGAGATGRTGGSLLAGSVSGPQPLPQDGRARQGSLFDSPRPRTEDLRAAAAVDELPAFAGRAVLMLLEEGLLCASDGWERLYTGPDEDLAARLLQGGGTAPLVVCPDLKALLKARPAFAVLPVARCFDLSLAAYLLSPEDRGYGFAQISGRWGERSGLSPTAAPGPLALALHTFMDGQLAGAGLSEVFRRLEMPLAPVLGRMEERGIAIDRAAFAAFLDEVQADLDAATARVHELAGGAFNIRSSQQLADVLFVRLGLPKAGKTRGGAASTSDESLEKIAGAHDIVTEIQKYRKLEKLRSTYLEPLPKLADAAGRIHTTFNQTATATGRLSSSNPNLQNIPVRGEYGTRMRGCFVAAPGSLIVSADYSQIELRVLAHLSGDPELLAAFRNNEDIHSRTAGLLFDLPLDKVTPDMRRNAKTINFGLVYGMGAQKLAQELKISAKEAKSFIERYFERLSTLKAFYDAVEEEARRDGFVTTMGGRRRLTPDILSANTQLRSQARRQAINTRIQGSAADIIKLAMLAVEEDGELRALGARLLLQIHDELLLEAPEAAAEAAGRRLAALMGGVNPGREPLSVPLLVDWGAGRTWAQAH